MKWATKQAGRARFVDLPGDVQDDVVAVLSGEDPDDDQNDHVVDVRALLQSAEVTVVSVRPRTLAKALSRREVSSGAVDRYRRAIEAGAELPPIVIDSRKHEFEGGHRVAAALQAGLPWITAIDVADAREVRVEDPYARGAWYYTFEFPRAR